MYKLEPDWGQKLNLSSEIEKISVLTCDIDKDGKQGIIIGADKVYAFDIHGVSQWTQFVKGRVKSLQIDSLHNCDVKKSIFVASCMLFETAVGSSALIVQKAKSELKLLDINGRAKVKHAFEGWFIRDFDVADTNSDGIKEIIISLDQIGNRSKGAIIVYSFKKGIIWERSLPSPIIRLACMRSEKYGYLITAISQNGKIYGINNRGLLIWEYETIPQGCLLTKIPPSCNNNRNTGIIASSSTEAWCLDENGNPLWRYDASSRILAIHVAIHMGLTCSILLGCEGALHLLDCEGNLQFKINLEGKMHLVNSMVTNGDGSLVLIACSKEGQIYLVSQSGNLMLRHDESYKIAGCCQFGFGPNQGLLICGLKSTGWFRNSLEYRAIVLKKYSILSS